LKKRADQPAFQHIAGTPGRRCLLFTISSLMSLTVSAFAAALPEGYHDAYGPLYTVAPNLDASPRHGPRKGLDTIRRWNQISIDASGLDHTPPAPGETRVFGQQLGPRRASRAIAIVHIAMFDTMNAVVGEYQSYTGLRAPVGALSMQAAISQAAHDTLTALFSAQKASFDAFLAEDLSEIKNEREKASGIDLGQRAAASILALRANDGSEHGEPVLGTDWVTSDQ